MAGPGYTFKDLVSYSGFIGGCAITYVVLQQMELDLHRLVRLLIAAAVGGACGWVASKLYESMTKPFDEGGPRP